MIEGVIMIEFENCSDLEKIIEKYNSQYFFDEETEENLNYILYHSSDEDYKTYQSLKKIEEISHDPETQYKLADILMKMAMNLHQIEHPRSPICQWFMEMRYSPALYWSIKAVNQHYFPAYDIERTIVEQGAKDVKPNFQLAEALLFKAASEGDASALLKLAIDYGCKSNGGFNAPPRYVGYNPEKSKQLYAEVEAKQAPETFKYFARNYGFQRNYEKSNEYYRKLIALDNRNRIMRAEIVYNYIKMNNLSSAAMEVLDIIANESDAVLLYTFKSHHPDGWESLNDIELERFLLEKLISNGNSIAAKLYENRYKRTLFSKRLKRLKNWGENIY